MKRRIAAADRIALALAILLALCAAPARGILVSDDPDLHVVTAPSEFDRVGYLSTGGGTTGMLINEWYFLTAKHAVANMQTTSNPRMTLHLDDGEHVYAMAEKSGHPTADLAVVRLKASTQLAGYELYTDIDENSLIGTMVGYGMSGTGESVLTYWNPSQPGGDYRYPRGTLRVGYNRILTGSGVDYMEMDFDDPATGGFWGSLGADKEAMFGNGDSGGPTFIDDGGTLKVAGIHSALYDVDQNGRWPDYGDIGNDVRVSTYAAWILAQMPDQPATETGDFDGNGLLNLADVDGLFDRFGGDDFWYDLSGDQAIDMADTDILIRSFMNTEYGDTDLDGDVDFDDYLALAGNFGSAGPFSYSNGDLDGDDDVDFADYQVLESFYGFNAASAPPLPPAPIPEPAALLLVALGTPVVLRRRRRAH